MKSKNLSQLVIFLMFTLCFVLFAEVENKLKGKKDQVVWDSNEKITAEAQVSNVVEAKKEIDMRINNKYDKVVKEEKKDMKVENLVVKNEEVIKTENKRELVKEKKINLIKKAETPNKDEKVIDVAKKEMKTEKIFEKVAKKVENERRYENVEIRNTALHKLERVVKSTNQTISNSTENYDPTPPPTKINFLPVNYVRQLTPAGKAALDAMNSGE